MPTEAPARLKLSARLRRLERLVRKVLAQQTAGVPEFLGIAEGAALVSVSPTTIRLWLNSGRLRGYRPCGRVLVRRVELVNLVATSTRQNCGRGTYDRNGQGG